MREFAQARMLRFLQGLAKSMNTDQRASTFYALTTTMRRSTAVSRVLGAALLGAMVASQLGCVAAGVTTAAVGVLSAADRRTAGAIVEDQNIELKAPARLLRAIRNSTAVDVTSYNRQVLLLGQVLDEAEKVAAEKAIRELENVNTIYNELAVGSGTDSVAKKAKDGILSTKVKSELILTSEVGARHIKVVSDDGVVYLLGLVTRREGEQAAQVTSRVAGVRKVVTLWEFIQDRDGNSAVPSPPPWAAPAPSSSVVPAAPAASAASAAPLAAPSPAATPGAVVTTAPVR